MEDNGGSSIENNMTENVERKETNQTETVQQIEEKQQEQQQEKQQEKQQEQQQVVNKENEIVSEQQPNLGNDELGGAVMAVPKWKQKQLQKAREIQQQVDAVKAQNAEPTISDEEFEKILDVIGIPETQRPQMRAFDNKKRNMLKAQAETKKAQEAAKELEAPPTTSVNNGNTGNDELGGAVMAVPKWKQKQLQKAREIQQQVDAVKSQNAEPIISDEEFEKILDKVGVPEFQRVEMRKFDNHKRKLLKDQAENQNANDSGALVARGNPTPFAPPQKTSSRMKSRSIFSRGNSNVEDVLETDHRRTGSITTVIKKSLSSFKSRFGSNERPMGHTDKIDEGEERPVVKRRHSEPETPRSHALKNKSAIAS